MRVAVLGLGSIGARHLRNLRSLGVSQLLAYDPRPESASVAEAAGAAFFDDPNALFAAGPDAAVVAAPTDRHLPLALGAARHGCHLFLEKPLSHTTDGLDALEREVAARGLAAMVACNMRFHPGPAAVRRLLAAGAAGRPLAARVVTESYLPRWRPASDYRASYSASPESGGVLLDCIHEIDLALWFLGPATLAGAAVLPASGIGLAVDGLAELLLAHACGAVSSVRLSFVSRDYHRACRVVGEEGTLAWDFHRPEVLCFGPDGVARTVAQWSPDWEVNAMYRDEMRHFLDCLVRGDAPQNPLSEARASLDVALAARNGGGRP